MSGASRSPLDPAEAEHAARRGPAAEPPAGTAQTNASGSLDASPRMLAQRAARDAAIGPAALPPALQSGIESLSGVALDHVNVHYDSAEPARLNAHAFAQGTDIHVAPGQEQHLPHEAWHLVQQAQGRVAPTGRMPDGTPVNDERALESEADVMGARALGEVAAVQAKAATAPVGEVVQRNVRMKSSAFGDKTDWSEEELRAEVAAVIERCDRDEVTRDIGRLEESIRNREAEQRTWEKAKGDEYYAHQHRIEVEKELLEELRELKQANWPARPRKPKTEAAGGGWTKVNK